MIKSNPNKIFSISGFSFIIKIHDGNIATINMNNTLKIYSGKKPFNCLNGGLNISKGTEIYNLKEIFIFDDINHKDTNNQNTKIYLILFEKNILIYSFQNMYKKHFLLQKIKTDIYIEILNQLNDKNIIFFNKENNLKIMQYKKENKNIFNNTIYSLQKVNKNKQSFILSFLEFNKNHIVTTSTSRHPSGENIIRLYEIQFNYNNSKLINYKNFDGYSCAIFENNICKLEKQKTICIALNFYIKKNIVFNNSAIVLLNYEYLEITTILEIDFQINSIFNFSFFSGDKDYGKIYEYILLSQIKADNINDKKNKKGKDSFRFIDFYVFEPKNEYEPILIENKRITTNNSIDITNSFFLNKKYLVIFQTPHISIYEIF